eukprot:scpid108283/ scgid15385/ 
MHYSCPQVIGEVSVQHALCTYCSFLTFITSFPRVYWCSQWVGMLIHKKPYINATPSSSSSSSFKSSTAITTINTTTTRNTTNNNTNRSSTNTITNTITNTSNNTS